MSLLSQVLAAAGNAARQAQSAAQAQPQRSAPVEDPRLKETRATYKKFLEKAVKDGNTKQLDALSAKAEGLGIDTTPYRTVVGLPSQKERFDRAIQKAGIDFYNTDPNAPAGTQPSAAMPEEAPVQTPLGEPDTGPVLDMGDATPTDQVREQQAPSMSNVEKRVRELFGTGDFAQRYLAKQMGMNIGENYGEEESWYDQLQAYRAANPKSTMKEAVNTVTMQQGWTPDSASNLKDLSPEEQDIQAETTFGNYMNNQALRAELEKIHPQLKNDAAAAGFFLSGMRANGYKIPQNRQALLDRFDGLADEAYEYEMQQMEEKIKRQGLAKEAVEQATFGSQIERVAAMEATKEGIKRRSAIDKAKQMREVNQPRPTEKTRREVAATADYVKLTNEIVDKFSSLYRQKGLEGIPTGFGESVKEFFDNVGLLADQDRVFVRQKVSKMQQLVFEIGGSQLTNNEKKLLFRSLPQMSDNPATMITKFSSFQRNLIATLQNKLEVNKAAGIDTSGLETVLQDLRGIRILDDVLHGINEEFRASHEAQKTAKPQRHKVSQQPAPPKPKVDFGNLDTLPSHRRTQ